MSTGRMILGITVSIHDGHFPLKVANLAGEGAKRIERLLGDAGASASQMREDGTWILYYALRGVYALDVPGKDQKVLILKTGAALFVDGESDEYVDANAKGKFPVLKRFVPNFACDGKHAGTVSDYHPITKDEVRFLLAVASVAKFTRGSGMCYAQTVSQIQVRLGQAIEGCTCPRSIEGPIAQQENRLDETYVRYLQSERELPFDDRTLDEMYGLITGMVVTPTIRQLALDVEE